MKLICKLMLYTLWLFPALATATNDGKFRGKYTEEKQITKEYPVSDNATLDIQNAYGNIDISTWDTNEISIKVSVKVNGNDQEKVQEKLDDIQIDFNASNSEVSARTVFTNNVSSWWQKLASSWSNSSVTMEVNYTVKMPSSNHLDLTNDYGSIRVSENSGGTKIHCDYGQLLIGELNGDSNEIYFDYTNNSTIKYMKNGSINADYSDFTLEDGGEIKLNADYSNSTINKAKWVDYNCDYGVLKLGDIGTIKGNGDYIATKVNSVSKAFAVNSDYGSVSVEHIKASVKTVLIKTDYTGVRVHYDPELNFNFRLKTSYGSIKLDENDLTIMKKNVENTSKDFEGYRGEKNSGNEVNISTSYGGVKLYKR